MAAREAKSWGRRRAHQCGVPVGVLRRELLALSVRLQISTGQVMGVVPTRRSAVVAAAAGHIFTIELGIVSVEILFHVGQLQLVAQFGVRMGHVGAWCIGGRRRKVTVSGMLD